MSWGTFRMRTESPGALIDEYTEKVERLRGEDGNSALDLALAQKVGERQFWRYQQHLAQSGDPVGPTTPATGSVPARTGQPPGVVPPQPAPAPAATARPGATAIKAGAYMLGIGVVDCGRGALIVSSHATGAVLGVALVGGITIGAILVAVGFLTLIIGALIRLGSD